ncbi:hypothetical protein ABHN09_16520 [Bacillus paramobilis]|uniref:hypothetical protein n=1 Tax=Bacillus paramobilis TaxID=2817477 RepID=UPI003D25DA85
MNIDIKILAAFISVIASALTFLILHLYIEPKKAKRNLKMEQYKNLYAPLYTMINSSVNIVKEESIRDGYIHLGHTSERTYLSPQSIEQFIFKNAGFASIELIEATKDLASSFGEIKKGVEQNLVEITVKEYNQLRYELGMEYNKAQLSTGIPDVIKEFREIS